MLSRSSFILSMIIALTVAGCGGGSSSTATSIATGQFKDNNTSGLAYVSGAQSGVTATDGSFTYEVGKPVTFKIGNVTVGTISAGKSTVTPLDLVTAGNSSTANVTNRVRFLMMLDSDNNLANGITISSAVQAAAALWSQPGFDTSADISADSALTGIKISMQGVTGTAPMLPLPAAAQVHLESTLRCAYAGAYKGTFSGADSGQFGVLVDATSGNVSGVAYSKSSSSAIILTGTSPVSYDQNAAFTSGNTSTGSTFSGKYNSVNGVSGTWNNTASSASGSFSGARIGGASNAVYRYTGQFGGSDKGLFTFDIDSAGKVTGVGYSVPSDTQFTVTGTLTGTALSGTSSTGATITATLNTGTGVLSGGAWSNTGTSGTFTGSGCKLN